MNDSEHRTQTIPVELEDRTAILVEVTQTGRQDGVNKASMFKSVTDALGGIA